MTTNPILPGMLALGHGYNPSTNSILTARGPVYDFDYANDSQTWTSPDSAGTYIEPNTQTTYSIPKYVNFSANFSTGYSTVQMIESRSEIEENLALTANVHGQYGLFSATIDASYSVQREHMTDYNYCSKKFDAIYWTVDIDARLPPSASFVTSLDKLPASYASAGDVATFKQFFDSHGTHVITAAQVGGSAALFTAVKKSSSLDKTTITAQVNAEYGDFFSAKGSVDYSNLDKSYVNARTSKEIVHGGDPGKVSTLQAGQGGFAEWSNSIPVEPGVIKLQLVPVGKLASDVKHGALIEAAAADYVRNANPATLHVTARSDGLPTCHVGANDVPCDAPVAQSPFGGGLHLVIIDAATLNVVTNQVALFRYDDPISPPADVIAMRKALQAATGTQFVCLHTFGTWGRFQASSASMLCALPEIVNIGGKQSTLNHVANWYANAKTIRPGFAYSVIGIPGGGGHEKLAGDLNQDGSQTVSQSLDVVNDTRKLRYVMS